MLMLMLYPEAPHCQQIWKWTNSSDRLPPTMAEKMVKQQRADPKLNSMIQYIAEDQASETIARLLVNHILQVDAGYL